jgi:hypothetical protein
MLLGEGTAGAVATLLAGEAGPGWDEGEI